MAIDHKKYKKSERSESRRGIYKVKELNQRDIYNEDLNQREIYIK